MSRSQMVNVSKHVSDINIFSPLFTRVGNILQGYFLFLLSIFHTSALRMQWEKNIEIYNVLIFASMRRNKYVLLLYCFKLSFRLKCSC